MSRVGVLVLLTTALSAPALAQDEPGPAPARPHVVGPQTVSLREGIELDLAPGLILYERAVARAMLEERGDDAHGVLGIVTRVDAPWEVVLDDSPVGYVSDADADQLEPRDLMLSLLNGNREQNKVRVEKGVAELFIDGWSQKPRYDRERRILTWGLDLHYDDQKLLNEFTNVLGRSGYIGLNLIVDPTEVEAARAEAAPVYTGIRYLPGHRYEDFDPSVDKDSGLGLTGLIVGGGVAAAAAKKGGLLALLLVILKKFGVFIAVAAAGLWKWLTGRRSKRAAEAPPPPPPPPEPAV